MAFWLAPLVGLGTTLAMEGIKQLATGNSMFDPASPEAPEQGKPIFQNQPMQAPPQMPTQMPAPAPPPPMPAPAPPPPMAGKPWQGGGQTNLALQRAMGRYFGGGR